MQTEFGIIDEHKLRVRYEETDQMGFVYYGNYFTWFEVGRTSLFRSVGLPYTYFESQGIMLPVTDADCKYKSSARYDDVITVRTVVTKLTPARINFAYTILSDENRILACGNTGHAFVDRNGRPLNLAKRNAALWDQIKANMPEENQADKILI